MAPAIELLDSYELYEFIKQYYLEIDSNELKKLKFPVAVYFDNRTGKPVLKSADKEDKKFKVSFENCGDKYYFESNDIQEILDFVSEKSARRIKPGDKVIIMDANLFELENIDFFKNNFIEYEFSCKYDYGNLPVIDEEFIVIAAYDEKVLIKPESFDKYYIIKEKGVKLV